MTSTQTDSGACAVTAVLSASGLPTNGFLFAGFLIVLVSFAGVSGYALYRMGQLREIFGDALDDPAQVRDLIHHGISYSTQCN